MRCEECAVFGRPTQCGGFAVDVAVATQDISHFCFAERRGGSDERVEHWLQIEGRAADDLEHVAGRGLVFQRFLQIARAAAQLIEQPGVFDRNHRLVGEGAHQADLLFGERLDPLAREHDDANQRILAQERHPQHCAEFSDLLPGRPGVFGVVSHIHDVHDPAFEGDPAGDRPSARGERLAFDECLELGRISEGRRRSIHVTFAAHDGRRIGFAEPRRSLDLQPVLDTLVEG